MFRRLFWYAVLVGCLGFMACRSGVAQEPEPGDKPAEAQQEGQKVDDARKSIRQQHVTPGAKGEPPGELKAFEPPGTLVQAGGHLDGGTTWVVMHDEHGTYLLFCVYQQAFEDEIAANSLFIGAYHPDETSARLPFTAQEAGLVTASLESALAPLLTPERTAWLKRLGDPGEEMIYSQATGKGKRDDDDWSVAYAHDALRRLKSVKEFPLADRAEVEARIARLAAVNLEDAARAFRERAGEFRMSEWKTLEPVLKGHVADIDSDEELARLFTEALGPPDAEALKEIESGLDSPFEQPVPIEGNVFAYSLGFDGLDHTLVVDFRGQRGASFGIVWSSRRDDTPTPHDLITQEEKDLGAELDASSINLGGGSLDGSFKQGFSLGLAGERVTDERMRQLMKLSTLVSLDLTGPNVTDERLAILKGHPYLASLTLENTAVTDDGLQVLGTLPTLKFLTLGRGAYTDAGVEMLQKTAPQCEIERE